MVISSIRGRLAKLENNRRFLDWFITERFYGSLTADELLAIARDGHLPVPLANRPSSLDNLDRKSLIKLWEQSEQTFGGRSCEEMKLYAKNGFWPERRSRLHYSMQDGGLVVNWSSIP